MGGTVEFKEALRTRLGVMHPSRQAVDKFLADHPHRVTKGGCGGARRSLDRCTRTHIIREDTKVVCRVASGADVGRGLHRELGTCRICQGGCISVL